MRSIVDFIKFIWTLIPAAIVWLFYILPLILTGSIKYYGKEDTYIWIFEVQQKDTWYCRAWKDWGGWSGPCVILFRPGLSKLYVFDQYLDHEADHCLWQTRLGIFFYPAYFFNSMFIYLFKKDKHAYHDNFFEIKARKSAGQKIDIPRSEWMHGTNDRIPWF